MLLNHPIGYDRSGQNKLMRDEELISRKVEHLSTVKWSDGRIWSIQLKRTPLFKILQTRIDPQYTYMLGLYVTRSITAVRKRHIASFDEHIIFLRSTGHLRLVCLIARVVDNLINFQAVVKKEGLVSSSYSSAVEFPTAITDRLRE